MKSSLYNDVLLFIPCYKAEITLSFLFDRLPKDMFSCREIIICDDASPDNTFREAEKIKRRYSNVKIFRHSKNMGYGGNQKFAYNYAIKNKFTYVMMLHGDLQYAPEEAPYLLKKIVEGNFDMLFGSRIKGNPIKGGMPLWRFFGNKFLTSVENLLFGMRLSEFHSGYRIYRCSSLEHIKFKEFTNDYHFDTQMLVAFHEIKFKIGETKISTNYGEFSHNISFLRAVLYGFQIIRLALFYRLNKMFNISQQLR